VPSTQAASDKVYQLLAHGRWLSPGTPASSTIKTGRHDIDDILLNVALKHQQSINQSIIKRGDDPLNVLPRNISEITVAFHCAYS
jgi:hypothetical protein